MPRKSPAPRPGLPEFPKWLPYAPPDYEIADVAAIQAIARGQASADQQVRALKYIVEKMAATYDISFRPGEDGPHVTAFAEGKRFVGLQIVKFTTMSLSLLKGKPTEQG